jgi:hypothetical protein
MRISRNLFTIISGATMILFVSSLQTSQITFAQQANVSQQSSAFTNFTGSIPLANSLLDVLKSKIKVTLVDAIDNVTKTLGQNSTVISGSIQPEAGFLSYRIVALDGNNTIHMILVDPGNGNVLSQQQGPAGMSGILSSEPAPQLSTIPNLGVP